MLWKRKLMQKSSLHKKFIRLVKFDIFLMIFFSLKQVALLPQLTQAIFQC